MTCAADDIERGACLGLVFGFSVLISAAVGQSPPSTYNLVSQKAPGSIDRVESALEVTGQLSPGHQAREGQKTSVLANLFYNERTVPSGPGGASVQRAVRFYDRAGALIHVGQETFRPALRDSRRLIVAEVKGTQATLFSPAGPLTWEELTLIDVLGNSLLVEQLLPPTPVAVGGSWKHSGELVAALLGLDVVSEHDVRSGLAEVSDSVAKLEMAGKVQGTTKGARTNVELKGKYQFDLRQGRVTWFALLVQEQRSAGPVEQGLEVVARLQMRISPGAQSPELSDAALARLNLEPTPELTLLEYRSPEAGWEWLHDRRWYLTADIPSRTVFRLVDRGDLLAQCTVSPLPGAARKQVGLAEFQQDIQNALGKAFKQFVRASEPTNPAGYRINRVVVDGQVEDVPVQWIYYLVGDEQGHQVVFAFSIEAELVGRFGQADEALIQTVRLFDVPNSPKRNATSPGPTAR